MCDKCGDKTHVPSGTLQTLGLKALSLYETPYISQAAFTSAFTTLAGNASGDIGIVPIIKSGIYPRQLHQQPGISVNCYALVKDPIVTVVATGALATLPQFAGVLYYRDVSGTDHALCPVSIGQLTSSVLNIVAGASATIVVPPAPFTSGQPSDLGKLVLNGVFTLAGATNVTFTAYVNIGFLYGVPR